MVLRGLSQKAGWQAGASSLTQQVTRAGHGHSPTSLPGPGSPISVASTLVSGSQLCLQTWKLECTCTPSRQDFWSWKPVVLETETASSTINPYLSTCPYAWGGPITSAWRFPNLSFSPLPQLEFSNPQGASSHNKQNNISYNETFFPIKSASLGG